MRPQLIPKLTRWYKYACLVLLLAPVGCYILPSESIERPPAEVEGYRPVYGTEEQTEIRFVAARAVHHPGKIYVYHQYLLVNELNEGIHVFDNSDPAHPQALGFVQMPGNSDMAIRNETLYADHMGNLVALTVEDFSALKEKARLPLRNWDMGVPPPRGFYFECVDQEKGIVLSWKKVTLTNPKCYATW